MTFNASKHQLTLAIDLPDSTDFSNYIWGENAHILSALEHYISSSEDPILYLWGEEGVGLTHLLMGCCHFAGTLRRHAAYISLSTIQHYGPEILDGIENVALVCIDDVETIAGNSLLERALFHCYNRVIEQQGHFIVAARQSPSQLGILLPDLKSRLAAGSVYQVKPLNDENKMLALMSRAKSRGFELSEEVVKYLLSHCERDTKKLFSLLTKFEQENLIHQRRLTVPFVKGILSQI